MKFSIDLLRHLFVLAVIVQHMTSESRYSVGTNAGLASFVDWIDGAVAGFFFISGFLFKSPESVWAYSKKQAIRLLIPFFLFSVTYALILSGLDIETLRSGLIKTATLHGSGMQLYFLPFFLLIKVSHACLCNLVGPRFRRPLEFVLLFVLVTVCLQFPTRTSTGDDYQLLPYYYGAFVLGSLYQASSSMRYHPVGVVVVLLGLVAIGVFDKRFFDLAGIVALFAFASLIAPSFPNRRLPGSGGIYLLHTPVVNYTISTLLVAIGVFEGWNIVLSVVTTYALCLWATLLFIRLAPKYRWMLLE
jgi:hypothetical protein